MSNLDKGFLETYEPDMPGGNTYSSEKSVDIENQTKSKFENSLEFNCNASGP